MPTSAELVTRANDPSTPRDPARFTADLHRLAAASPDQGLRLLAEQSLAGGGHS